MKNNNIRIYRNLLFKELKHGINSGPWVIGQNIILTVLIHNLKTAWRPTEM